MKLLIFSQYFWPETFIINDVAKKLKQLGHEVVVATGKPNYPDGNIFDGYRAYNCQTEEYHEGIKVFRVPVFPRGKGGTLRLILNYLSFVVSGSVLFPWLLRGRSFDHILVFAPSPITQAIPAIVLKFLKRVPVSVWVQDLWPESLSATGYVRSKSLLFFLRWMVKSIYFFMDKILIQSPGFFKPIARLADTEKIIYYPNSVLWEPESKLMILPASLDQIFNHPFCVVFAGNIGKAQSFETIVEAAKILKVETGIRIVIVGSGSMLDWVIRQKLENSLDNIVLAGRYPMHLMPSIYAKSSALLVTLRKDEILGYTIPSKVQAYLAAGKPIIAALDGEGAKTIQEANAGFACAAEDSEGLAQLIKIMSQMKAEDRKALGDNGHAYFRTHFEMSAQVEKLVNIMNNQNDMKDSH